MKLIILILLPCFKATFAHWNYYDSKTNISVSGDTAVKNCKCIKYQRLVEKKQRSLKKIERKKKVDIYGAPRSIGNESFRYIKYWYRQHSKIKGKKAAIKKIDACSKW